MVFVAAVWAYCGGSGLHCTCTTLHSHDIHMPMQVCCGSGLQRIYEFLQTDEHCARPDLDLTMIKVSLTFSCVMHGC